MEKLSNRESILLGYSPQRNISNNLPTSSPDSPDIDFHDVFGGPPRRASIQETRCSFGENDTDSYALTTSSHRHRWSGLSERPVFGEDSATRRRYTSHDFFDDIFRVNESLSTSPRKNETDSFSSNPGSKVLSPVRPLPPRAAEPFPSASLPAQFSLPAKLIKGTDLPTFGSSARNHHKNKDGNSNAMSSYAYSPLSRVSSQENLVEESRSDVYIKSSLSREPSVNSLESSLEKPDEMDKGGNLKKDSSETSNSNRFHFSIYKWASKGVPLALPLRGGNTSKLKEKVKLERSSSTSGRVACEGRAKELPTLTSQDIDRPSYTWSNCISTDAKSSEIELDKKERGFLLMTSTTHGRVEEGQTVEEAALKSEPENQRARQETVKDSAGNNIFRDSKGERKTHSVIDTGKSGKRGEKIPEVTRETPETELKTLHSLMLGADEITIKNELKESKVKSTKRSAAVFNVSEKVKKQVEARTILNGSEMDKANLQGSPKESNGGLTKNRGRQKVKEFVKIFNQEASGKPTFNSDSQSPQSQSSRWKERGKFKPEEDPSVAPTKLDDKVHLPNGNKNHKPHASIRVNEFLKQFEKQHSETRSHNHEPTDISSGLKDKSASTAASIPDGSKAVLEDPDDSFQGNILIKELPQDENELPQAGDNQEVFQDIDTKIRKWSDGKEGNIRSLLSTLQYVLWPESGWKPVPLVDIIEGNAVKRSYQKALLTLHPDKLQQKGATSHQKYIAEKVFDVLQEAWTHFTSVGSM
ncbi:J domain-containing protein required for chloroplast accumulation response 1 isoform X1 [Ricinus communis]|uniref:J domain-containing protein required for chloroplast accumulation response 1 isoform X1 n=1 Tax=Ricinus communis TaxID=3988 RepID=UPI000772A603|nr:J domain-containing protein required for chloroplast accumulation response 1 isoform X1 [Ricinus communis]|eukprot:XP_015575635.1 J domain-containing protein required for chloroplast accumulation response 1 [Ricinus communis]